MKVGDLPKSRPGLSGGPVREELKTGDTGEVSFRSRFLNVQTLHFEDQIRQLADRIVSQGEILAKKTDIRELKIYKQLVSEFLNQTVGNSHKFSRRSLLDRRGRHRVYALVIKVDEALNDLTEDILSSEKDNLSILQKLDDIRGMLLDLIL